MWSDAGFWYLSTTVETQTSESKSRQGRVCLFRNGKKQFKQSSFTIFHLFRVDWHFTSSWSLWAHLELAQRNGVESGCIYLATFSQKHHSHNSHSCPRTETDSMKVCSCEGAGASNFSSTTSALVLQCSQEFHALLFVHVCAILTYWPWNAWNANVNASLKQLIYTEESSFLCRASNCISLYPEFQFQINSKSCWLHCDLWRPRMWFLEHPGHKLWKMSSQANRIHRSLGQNESLVFFGFGR